MIQLSTRLQNIANLVQPQFPIYDLCCDHALIAKYFYFAPEYSHTITAIDVSPTVIEREKKWKEQNQITEQLKFVELDICELKISENKTNIILSGVGADLIIHFLSRLDSFKHNIICSPQKDSFKLREFLQSRSIKVSEEVLVKEKTRFREILLLNPEGYEVQKLARVENQALLLEYQNWLQSLYEYRKK